MLSLRWGVGLGARVVRQPEGWLGMRRRFVPGPGRSPVRGRSAAGRGFLEDFDAVGDGAGDEAEAFHSAPGFAWQADDQGAFDHGCEAAGEDGVGGDPEGFHAHGFPEAGEFTDGDLPDRLRGDIAEGDPGAASGEDQVATAMDEFADGALDVPALIRDEGFRHHLPAVADGRLADGGSTEIIVQTL